jgi:hypothetical protein
MDPRPGGRANRFCVVQNRKARILLDNEFR